MSNCYRCGGPLDEWPPGFVDAHLPDECVTELMNEIARLNDQIAQLKAAADEGRGATCKEDLQVHSFVSHPLKPTRKACYLCGKRHDYSTHAAADEGRGEECPNCGHLPDPRCFCACHGARGSS